MDKSSITDKCILTIAWQTIKASTLDKSSGFAWQVKLKLLLKIIILKINELFNWLSLFGFQFLYVCGSMLNKTLTAQQRRADRDCKEDD